LHKSHEREADKLLDIPSVQDRLKEILRVEKNGDEFVAKRVKLFFECDHFGSCYPLNRFFGILISKYLDKIGISVLYDRVKFKNIKGVDHTCKGDWKDCIANKGKGIPKHKVIWQEDAWCNEIELHKEGFEIFDKVLVRFGLDADSMAQVFSKTPSTFGTQMLPYSLP
jgi:hypothetical protein